MFFLTPKTIWVSRTVRSRSLIHDSAQFRAFPTEARSLSALGSTWILLQINMRPYSTLPMDNSQTTFCLDLINPVHKPICACLYGTAQRMPLTLPLARQSNWTLGISSLPPTTESQPNCASMCWPAQLKLWIHRRTGIEYRTLSATAIGRLNSQTHIWTTCAFTIDTWPRANSPHLWIRVFYWSSSKYAITTFVWFIVEGENAVSNTTGICCLLRYRIPLYNFPEKLGEQGVGRE